VNFHHWNRLGCTGSSYANPDDQHNTWDIYNLLKRPLLNFKVRKNQLLVDGSPFCQAVPWISVTDLDMACLEVLDSSAMIMMMLGKNHKNRSSKNKCV
jgi:hypothetical protein